MSYSEKTIKAVTSAPKTLGNQLGRWAIHYEFPVTKIAEALGVTRQSVYNWFTGREVFVAYRHRVENMLHIMQHAKNKQEAWSILCQEYNLEP